MLFIFDKTVGHIRLLEDRDDELQMIDQTESFSALGDWLATYKVPNSYFTDLRPYCFLVSTTDQKNGFIASVSVLKDDIYCFLRGRIENMSDLEAQFKLKEVDQPSIPIEAYGTQRLHNNMPETETEKFARQFYWFSVLKAARGKFTMVLFDNLKKTLFAATDPDAHLPFYWGRDKQGSLVLAMDSEMVKNRCGKYYGSFPKGSYISTLDGLKSYVHQDKEMKVVETQDSVGSVHMTAVLDGEAKRRRLDSSEEDSTAATENRAILVVILQEQR